MKPLPPDEHVYLESRDWRFHSYSRFWIDPVAGVRRTLADALRIQRLRDARADEMRDRGAA